VRASLSQFNPSQGWHVVIPLCLPCMRQLVELAIEGSKVFSGYQA
jgi:hypothetical protein